MDGEDDASRAHVHVYEPLEWTPRPEEIDAAFDRREPSVGVDLLRLALNHHDPHDILPRVARALGSDNQGLRVQGVVALAHVARLHRTVDRRCLELLRTYPRGNEADDDLWQFVSRHRLPTWLWRYHFTQRVRWLLRDQWRN